MLERKIGIRLAESRFQLPKLEAMLAQAAHDAQYANIPRKAVLQVQIGLRATVPAERVLGGAQIEYALSLRATGEHVAEGTFGHRLAKTVPPLEAFVRALAREYGQTKAIAEIELSAQIE